MPSLSVCPALARWGVALSVGLLLGGCVADDDGATRERTEDVRPADGSTVGSPDGRPTTTSDVADEEAGPVVHRTQVPQLHPSVDGYPTGTVELVAGDGTVHRLPVLVASTQQQRSHGLMEVPTVPAGTGMLFTYETDRDGAYTMRGTLTPLQIAWADADGTIVALADMVPCEAEPCRSYPPDATYRSALEVRAGWLDEIDVGLGDRLVVLAP